MRVSGSNVMDCVPAGGAASSAACPACPGFPLGGVLHVGVEDFGQVVVVGLLRLCQGFRRHPGLDIHHLIWSAPKAVLKG